MIHLSILGTLDLRGPDGAEIRSALAQPKRTALLAYLAVATPHGFHRRDTLFALFWPELDNGRARNALSKALHHLRQSLGEGVLLNRGEGEVGIARERLWCDAVAFEEALDAGEHAQALELYRGELLPGFHIPDAAEFERWLDEERARLRRRAAEAAWKLTDETEQSGDSVAAIRWAERAAALSPEDECAVRRLITLFERLGDRAGALRAYEGFARHLRKEYEADPSPETQELIDAVRERTHRRASALSPSNGEVITREDEVAVLVEPVAAPSSLQTTAAAPARRRRRWSFPASVAAVIALTTLGAQFLLQPRNRPRLVEGRVLVAAFENRTGDPGLDLLGEMAADWITQGLQQAALAQVVDPVSALLAARAVTTDSAHLTGPTRAGAIARGAGAGAVVWGTVYQQADSLHFHAQITDVREGRLLLALDPVSASVHDPLGGAERLREQVAGALASLLDRRLASISAASSHPPTFAAYQEYILGLEQFQRSRYADALSHFAAAARLDTTFALPLVWSAFAYGNSNYPQQRDSVVELLAARRERLAPLDRHALDYFLAQNRRDIVGQLEAARAAARLSPGSNWSNNAGIIAAEMNRPREALRHFQEVDPEHGWARGWFGYWFGLTTAHHFLGEHSAELEAARRARRMDSEDKYLRYLEIRAMVALGHLEMAEVQIEELRRLPPTPGNPEGEALRVLGMESWVHGHRELASRLFGLAVEWFRSPAAQSWIRVQPDTLRARLRVNRDLARALYAAGRWEEARALFESIAAQDSANMEARTHLALLAAQRGDRAEAERAIQFLEGLTGIGPRLEQARIATALSERERAMEYLQETFWRGRPGTPILALHREPDWDGLRDYPPFIELVRPRE